CGMPARLRKCWSSCWKRMAPRHMPPPAVHCKGLQQFQMELAEALPFGSVNLEHEPVFYGQVGQRKGNAIDPFAIRHIAGHADLFNSCGLDRCRVQAMKCA